MSMSQKSHSMLRQIKAQKSDLKIKQENIGQYNMLPNLPEYQSLFVPMSSFTTLALNILPKILGELLPLSSSHRADLPDAIRDLSHILTSERFRLNRSYWSTPRFISAYLRYFLPWNLVRLTHILPNLDLPIGSSEKLQILDLGSGPLTLPLALWISRPDWRTRPLTLMCSDTAPYPMELGRRLLEMLANHTHEPLVWNIQLIRASLLRTLAKSHQSYLIMVGNVLNEMRDKSGKILAERLNDLVCAIGRNLAPHGRVLFIEPGTRLGGTLIASFREEALLEGFEALAPCTHNEPCPLLRQRSRGWCHVSQDATGSVWLAKLAKEVGLPKETLSIAFLLLKQQDELLRQPQIQSEILARILSDAFSVPNMGFARYACTSKGLAILPHAQNLPSGALVKCFSPKNPKRDKKSGAIELDLQNKQESF